MLLPDDPGADAPRGPADPRPASRVMLRGEGRVVVSRRGSALALSRLSGVIEPVHVEWLLGELEQQVSDGVTTLFVDASRLTLLSSAASRVLSHWLARHRRTLRAVHVLVDATAPDAGLDALGPALHRWHEAEPFFTELRARGG